MTPHDPPTDSRRAPDSRRARRRGAAPRVALAWIDEDALEPHASGDGIPGAAVPAAPDLLARRPRRSPMRAAVLVPVASALLLAGAYVAATQLWPLDNVAPVVTALEVPALVAPASAPTWPEEGSAAIGVDGIRAAVSSTDDADSLASITKLVTVLMVLEQQPLTLGDQGPTYEMTWDDNSVYLGFLARGESALPVPVGDTLTQYQLMQGTLIASAGNYAERLTRTLWPDDDVFAAAAAEWLTRHRLGGITLVDPTGIGRDNTADPASVIALADLALAHPVVAEIVATERATLPGAGEIDNTNDLLGGEGVVGVKTGGLTGHYNLVAARDVAVGESTVRVYAAVLGQPTDARRDGETEKMLAQAATEVAVPQTLPADTVVGIVTTPWGLQRDLVTDADVSAILWNGASATSAPTLRVDDAAEAGDPAGSLTLTGPLSTATVGVHVTADVTPPGPWWRLTHPLELLGLD